jgi:inosine-uridine nucleoside N-ribohydrolase
MHRHVIVDTDVGSDIDDTFAIAFLLQLHNFGKRENSPTENQNKSLLSQGIIHQPKIQLKLINTCTGDARYRAQLLAQLLRAAHCEHEIPIGLGTSDENSQNLHAPTPIKHLCTKDYFTNYNGECIEDGVQRAVEIIMNGDYTTEPLVLLSLGPSSNIYKMLEIEPRIAERVHFIGMQGSFVSGYRGKKEQHTEYNTAYDVPASQKVLEETKWKKMTLIPLDTCAVFDIKGKLYNQLVKHESELNKIVFEHYRVWFEERQKNAINFRYNGLDISTSSTILYDCVAALFVVRESFMEMKGLLDLTVTKEGKTNATIVEPEASSVRAAMSWKDIAGFRLYLVTVLTMH